MADRRYPGGETPGVFGARSPEHAAPRGHHGFQLLPASEELRPGRPERDQQVRRPDQPAASGRAYRGRCGAGLPHRVAVDEVHAAVSPGERLEGGVWRVGHGECRGPNLPGRVSYALRAALGVLAPGQPGSCGWACAGWRIGPRCAPVQGHHSADREYLVGGGLGTLAGVREAGRKAGGHWRHAAEFRVEVSRCRGPRCLRRRLCVAGKRSLHGGMGAGRAGQAAEHLARETSETRGRIAAGPDRP